MRKLMNIFAAALVMSAAVGCEKSGTLPDNSSKVVTLTATINNGETKTSLGTFEDDKGYPTLWSEGDAIAVINNGKRFKFEVDTEDAGTTQGTFTCTEGDGFDAAKPLQAFYPYDGVTYDAATGTISYTVPATQTYQVKSFAQGAMPMAGYAANASGTVSFENLFGVVKLQLKGVAEKKVKSIEITSGNCISGAAALTITESAKSIAISSEDAAAKKVVLDCGTDGVALNYEDSAPATEFLIALPAGATGLKILVNTTEESYYKEVPTENSYSEQINTVAAGKILKMPVLNTADMAPAYIENGVCYGGGIALPKSADGSEILIWAPVNCGYDENHKYGLLYQWGRKYGQGYDGEDPEPALANEQLSYAANGSSYAHKNTFYIGYFNWLKTKDDYLWYNNTSGATTTKTDYDPCPAGWRVPTNAELLSLVSGLTSGYVSAPGQWKGSSEDSNHSGLPGFWFYGQKESPSDTDAKVFFPAVGYRSYYDGSADDRGCCGYYWSSSVNDSNAWFLFFDNNGDVYSRSIYRAFGHSVRCVKDQQVHATE